MRSHVANILTVPEAGEGTLHFSIPISNPAQSELKCAPQKSQRKIVQRRQLRRGLIGQQVVR